MEQGEYKVWNLLDPQDMASAVRHVEEQIDETQRDLDLVNELDRAMAQIEEHLLDMQELAGKALEPNANREALEAAFAAHKARLDTVAEEYASRLAPEEGARLKQLLESLRGSL